MRYQTNKKILKYVHLSMKYVYLSSFTFQPPPLHSLGDQGPVVRKLDNAIHRIVIFSSAVEMSKGKV